MVSEWSINQSINQMFDIHLNLIVQAVSQTEALSSIQATIVLRGEGGD